MKGDIQGKALQLLAPLYRADLVQGGWSLFLRELSNVIASDVAIAVVLDLDGRPREFMSEGLFSKDMMASYETHFAAIDPWPQAFLSGSRPYGKNVSSNELLSAAEFEKTEYYNDFWRPNNDLFYTSGALIHLGDSLANVGMPRCRDRGEYDDSDIALLDILSPHISAALQMHQRLRRADEMVTNAEAVLDQMGDAMLVVDGTGKIIHFNSAAAVELRLSSRVTSRNGRLVAGKLIAANDFGEAFGIARAISRKTETRSPISVVSRESNSEARATVTFHPLPQHGVDGVELSAGASILVVIRCAGIAPVGSPTFFRRLYGLTPTEARLAFHMASGMRVESIAATLKISVGTTRVHLKSVFLKTGTNRQGQLVALLNSASPRIGRLDTRLP